MSPKVTLLEKIDTAQDMIIISAVGETPQGYTQDIVVTYIINETAWQKTLSIQEARDHAEKLLEMVMEVGHAR
jgi:hypothetical protein